MLNLAALRKIVSAAALAGLMAGLLLSGLQQIHVVPAILEAETFEQTARTRHQSEHLHDHHGHEEHSDLGAEEEDAERTLYTVVANVTMAFGFALLLSGAMSLQGCAVGWWKGVLWGAAGYVTFFLAPSIGLPPDLPGTEAASLASRQIWWWTTACTTAAGLAMLFFSRNWLFRIAGIALIGIPHLVGAPQPGVHSSAAPADMLVSFLYATTVTNALFWLALGALTGVFYKRAA